MAFNPGFGKNVSGNIKKAETVEISKGAYAGYAPVTGEDPIKLVFEFSLMPVHEKPRHHAGEPAFGSPIVVLVHPDAKPKEVLQALRQIRSDIKAKGVFKGYDKYGEMAYKPIELKPKLEPSTR